MEALFSDIFNWIASLNPVWTYVVIFAVAYGENVVPPIPGDMVIVFGGYLASSTGIDFFLIWAIATAGGVLGFMTMYAIGHSLGEAVYSPDRYTWLPKNQLEKARRWTGRWGYWVVILNRFLAGTRTVISLVVGITHMDVWKTTVACTISAFVWTGLIVYLGYVVGENWEEVAEYLRVYGFGILGATLGVVVTLFVVHRMRRRGGNS